MGKSIFIDIRDKEIATYIFNIKQKSVDILDTRKYPLSGKSDYELGTAGEDFGNTYVSFPLSALNFRVIDLPFSDNERIREVVPFELDGVILSGLDKIVFDNVIIGSRDNKYQVLVVYVEKTLIREILEKLKKYNLDPLIITSLELRDVLKDFSIEKLFLPSNLDDADRIAIAIEEVKKPTINLRRDEFAYTKDIERTKKALKITAFLLALLIFIISSDVLLKIYHIRNEVAFLKGEIRRVYKEIFPDEKNIVNELHQLKSHLKALKEKEDLLIGVSPLKLLLELSQIDRGRVVFNELIFDRRNLTMKGEASSLGNIQELKNKLEHVFTDVNISDSRTSIEGKIIFTMTAKEKKN